MLWEGFPTALLLVLGLEFAGPSLTDPFPLTWSALWQGNNGDMLEKLRKTTGIQLDNIPKRNLVTLVICGGSWGPIKPELLWCTLLFMRGITTGRGDD